MEPMSIVIIMLGMIVGGVISISLNAKATAEHLKAILDILRRKN